MWYEWGKRKAYRIGGKTRRKGPLGRPIHRWAHNIKKDLGGIGWIAMDWMDLT
jgi:hypothetical protein